MPLIPSHCSWFEDTNRTLKTSDGKEVRILSFNHKQNNSILNEWALHFRRHYASDKDLAEDSVLMGMSQNDYLRCIKFPSITKPGPSIKSGDFSEILVADYIQFLMNYYVPRTRYDGKTNPDTSTHGTDILGFKLLSRDGSIADELITCEVKGALVATNKDVLQNAIKGSKKDFDTRLPISLNATMQRLKQRGESESLKIVTRFNNKIANPYTHISGAVVVCSDGAWNDEIVTNAVTDHPNKNTFFLAITGVELMDLANKLYETAYVTAQ